MKYSLFIILIIFVSCAHKKTSTTCQKKEIIEIPLTLAQCFNNTKQPLKALSIYAQYSKEDQNTVEWNLVEFESYLNLNKNQKALIKLHQHLTQSPSERYYIRLLKYYQASDEKEAFDSLRTQALKLYPDNKDIQMFNGKES
jgi:tetratricopeptide (TPR) repeat protein